MFFLSSNINNERRTKTIISLYDLQTLENARLAMQLFVWNKFDLSTDSVKINQITVQVFIVIQAFV